MVVSWIRRGSNHLFVERVDLAARRFVRLGRVEVVGEVTSNQILRHCLLLKWSSGRLVALPSLYSRSEDRKSTATPFFYFNCRYVPQARQGKVLLAAGSAVSAFAQNFTHYKRAPLLE